METSLDTLTLLAEVTIAFVAFAAIIATLRRTFGEQLDPFQRLLVRWFIETGMLTLSFELLPLVLAGFLPSELTIARYSIFYIVVTSIVYFIWYLRRRIRIKAPTPVASLIVMAGTMIWMPVLVMAGAGVVFQPSLAIIVAYVFWLLIAAAIVFLTFLSTFVFDHESGE